MVENKSDTSSTNDNDSAVPARVAVIAIHGVADQVLGNTAQTLAELLIVQTPNGAEYAPGERGDVILQVPLVAPVKALPKIDGGIATKCVKYLKQSIASDFFRHGQAVTGGKRALSQAPVNLTPGADFSDYLLAKAQQNDTPTDTYSAPRISLSRRSAGTAQAVDIYEMYWADLSRLSSKVPRILTELFTLLFRLSCLGRDTVHVAAAEFPESRAWLILRALQTGLDWAYSRVLALLFLQLIMIALILVPFGLLSAQTQLVHHVIATVCGAGTVLGFAYMYRRFLLGLILGALVGWGLWKIPQSAWLIGVVWLVAISYPYDKWLKICDERFRMVRQVGWSLWGLLLVYLLLSAWRVAPQPGLQIWINAALNSTEYVLVAILAWWAVVGVILLPTWLIAGFLAGRRSYEARASVSTGRLALIVSLGFFLVLAMSGWALFNTGVKAAVASFHYAPIIFQHDAALWDANRADCYPDPTKAICFLQDRFINSTESFAVIAVLLLGLVAYLLVAFTPSLLSEMQLTKDKSQRLGRWLTGGYRRLDAVVAGVAIASTALAFVVALLLLHARFPQIPWLSSLDALNAYLPSFRAFSWDFLEPLVLTAASATVAFSAAGGLLSRYVPSLRAPLDAGLDVDNHFREFPRRAIPRALIFSRYVALLNHVSRQGYDRIVVVSHSQGTIISAELFRYMKERAALNPTDAIGTLWGSIHGKLRLVTAGSPLRQLYAARFPVMYNWVLGLPSPGRMGATARDLGVTMWINLYATGDYVGRWLWSRPPNKNGNDISWPLVDDDGKHNKYVPDMAIPIVLSAQMQQQTEHDISLGAGAHTHYFDKDHEKISRKVAAVVDAMVAQ